MSATIDATILESQPVFDQYKKLHDIPPLEFAPRFPCLKLLYHALGSHCTGHIKFPQDTYALLLVFIRGAFAGRWAWNKTDLMDARHAFIDPGQTSVYSDSCLIRLHREDGYVCCKKGQLGNRLTKDQKIS